MFRGVIEKLKELDVVGKFCFILLSIFILAGVVLMACVIVREHFLIVRQKSELCLILEIVRWGRGIFA